MPFKKVGKNKYVSPSGRSWTKKQVVAYYASQGFTKPVKKKSKSKKTTKRPRAKKKGSNRRGKK